MKVLVLHSDVPADAPPEDQDTLAAADAVRDALDRKGYSATKASYRADTLGAVLELEAPDIVFNLVEGVDGRGILASAAPRQLSDFGMPFTGANADTLDISCDKPKSKAKLRAAGLATPDWSVPPNWAGLDSRPFIVKAALEDGSIGLDDNCVISGAAAIKARTEACLKQFGGAWFAEEYVEGREFNLSLLGSHRALRILPLAEMTFADWPAGKPRIVGYGAKWDEASTGYRHTVRRFGTETEDPVLATKLKTACEQVWKLFEMTGFVRIDFRVRDGEPTILEINPNPGITPDAGFAAAAAEAGMSYDDLIDAIVKAAQ